MLTEEKVIDTCNISDAEIDQFNIWLSEYQIDIKKIIGKYRRSNHALSLDELVSEINLSLIKKREDLINYTKKEGGFNYANFKKSAFVYTRNLIKWSHLSTNNKSYVKRRDNNVFYDEEDGVKTSFDIALETQGFCPEDDPTHFVNIDVLSKYKDFLNNIKKYYDIFSETEIKVLSMLEVGMTEEKIANKLEVTRQAVNYTVHNIYKIIKSYINRDDVFGYGYRKVQKGHSSIEAFFTNGERHIGLDKEHSTLLKSFVLTNKYKFTLSEITQEINKICNSDYNTKQICSSLNVRSLNKFVVRKNQKNN